MTDIRTPTRPADSLPPACAAVDERLMDYLEGDLAAADRAAVEAHLADCGRCRALVADLRAITADAAALPVLRPERDLWAGIAERIEAPVVPLQVRPTTRRAEPPARATVSVSRRWMAAAAAALVTVTSGVTYLATRGPEAVRAVATATPDTTARDTATPAPVAPGATVATLPAAPEPRPDSATPAPAPAAGGTARLAARRTAPSAEASVPGVRDYDRAIATLRTAVRERRADLDSGTVAVLERNLRIIDEAIRQSREALAGDPGSPLAGRALTKALDRKVELLRTVALMPRS
jgi:anti-sigma factor RsiW